MRGQLQRLGLSYDWRRETFAPRRISTNSTVVFLKMYEMGLAYKKLTQVNWCEYDKATLSNEQASGRSVLALSKPCDEKRFGAVVFPNDRFTPTNA